MGGFAAETGAAVAILIATLLGVGIRYDPIPLPEPSLASVRTRRLSAVRWGVAGRIVWAWILTIPCAAVTSALVYYGASALIH